MMRRTPLKRRPQLARQTPLEPRSKLDYQRERRKALEAWSRAVRARDGHRCQLCGRTGGQMHAHHLVPKTHSLTAMDVDNGVTLHARCHGRVHDRPDVALRLYARVLGVPIEGALDAYEALVERAEAGDGVRRGATWWRERRLELEPRPERRAS